MKGLLFVSVAFPPKNDPECLQTARYFRYLVQDKEFEVDVVTSNIPTLYMPEDKTLQTYNSGYRQLIELPLWESRLVSFMIRKFGGGNAFFPDSKMTFHWQWQKVIRRLKKKPDVIYSRSNPMSSAFMAMKLKKHYNVPWVMHMSDPWAISPLDLIPAGKAGQSWLQKEAELLQATDAVTFTSRQTLELYASHYPTLRQKFRVLPNVYDPGDIREPVSSNSSTKLRIIYTGGLAGNRNVLFLDQVFKIIQARDPQLLDKFEFVFAGALDRINRNYFSHSPAYMQHLGLISHGDVRKLCESAHLLLVVDNPTTQGNAIFFPSKLLDYFLVRKMIWAVTPESSATREILKDYNHRAFQHHEIERMASFLIESVTEVERAGFTSFVASHIPKAYDARENAKRLKDILLSVTHR
jgi:hypothetical protein